MNKGFVFSFESLISLLLFSILFISITTNTNSFDNDIDELIALKKGNDLLKIWSKEPDILQVKSDTEFVFGNNASVYIDGIKIVEAKFNGESISTSTKIIDEFLIEREIRIIVYFN